MSNTTEPLPTPAPVAPPVYPIAPAFPGAWFGSYAVITANSVDTYTGIAVDGSGFAISVPTGTPAWRALNTTPPPPTTIDPLSFMRRFTSAELSALVAANPLWGFMVAAAETINVADPTLVADIGLAVTAGAITQVRAMQVLDLAVASP